ncbi:hypothetical protein PV327_011528, partial [Microctonus hyperodae]
VNYTAGIENDSRLVSSGHPKDVVTRWIRKNDDDDLMDDHIVALKDLNNFFRNAASHYFKRLEVLLVEPGHYDWQPSSNCGIPNNAIEGGQNLNKTIYVCRLIYFGQYHVGMLFQVNRDDGICYSKYWGVNSTYDILVYKP